MKTLSRLKDVCPPLHHQLFTALELWVTPRRLRWYLHRPKSEESLQWKDVIGDMFEMVGHAYSNATQRHIIDILSPVIAGVREIAEFMRQKLPQMQCTTADSATALRYAMQCYHGEACDEEPEDWAARARLMMYSLD